MTSGSGSAAGFRPSIRFPDGPVVAVGGELDAAGAPELLAVLDALVDRGHDHITVGCDDR